MSMNDEVTAKVATTQNLDWQLQIPNEITMSPGESKTIPAKFFGSTEDRDIKVIITEADLRFGGVNSDLDNPQLPDGFTIDWPIDRVSMKANPNAIEVLDREIGTTNMVLSIDKSTMPGTYLLGIHMIDDDKKGSDGQTIDYLYVTVE